MTKAIQELHKQNESLFREKLLQQASQFLKFLSGETIGPAMLHFTNEQNQLRIWEKQYVTVAKKII